MSAEEVAPDLLQAFAAYEGALMSNDLTMLDALFADGPTTLRGDAAGLLVGHDQISAFRSGRGGAPARRLIERHVRMIDADNAVVVAVTELLSGGRGQQTQVWSRTPGIARFGGWQIGTAHVSVAGPAFDASIWRALGDPLAPPTGAGSLDGHTIAVKDLFAVAGQRIGAGNPAWLDRAPIEPSDAWAVSALRAAGASVRGITRTDELAYSLAGTNAHYGTPPNPRAPRRIPGGSSSGSASAVALGHATIGLGTDTGGSIRVPAAFQGLFGLRTTHGAVSRAGVLPLAPSFDTVGWMTRDLATLRAVCDVLLPELPPRRTSAVVTVPGLVELTDDTCATRIRGWRPDVVEPAAWPGLLERIDGWLAAFQTVQAWEAWEAHGSWLEGRLDVLGPDVRARFERARAVTAEQAYAARATTVAAGDEIRAWVGDRVLVLPATGSVAPFPRDAASARDATMRLTCLAGLGGLPALTVPLAPPEELPVGVCLVAAPGRDRDLCAVAAELIGAGRGVPQR